jgi:SAM-dependent methyltransferase
MLDIARKNFGELPPAIQRRVHLVRGDMSNFALENRFGLIYLAGNSFRELISPEERLRCLACVARHLRNDGVFLMTERRFDRSWFENGNCRSSDWTDPVSHPQTGYPVQRRFELYLSDDGRWISGQFFYRTCRPGGTEHIDTCPILAPVMTIADYEEMFAATNLTVTTCVGYDHRPEDGTDPNLCFVCQMKSHNDTSS